MPRFAANLSFLFTDLPFLDRFAAAADAGFDAVEFLFPYAYPAEVLATLCRDHGLEIVLFNLPPGDWDAGERGIAALPGREAEFEAGLMRALDYVAALGTRRLHAMAGLVPMGANLGEMMRTYHRNLEKACQMAAPLEVDILLEPINSRDMPGYAISHTRQAIQAIEAVGAPNLRLQLDLYHRQIMEGDLCRAIESHFPHVAHMQIANPPDRGEPDLGEIAYDYLFAMIDDLGYDGAIGCEYRPRRSTLEGLSWFEAWRRR